MQRKIIPILESTPDSFSWVREPNFTPPGNDGGVEACVSQSFAASRAGELRALLESFLESIIANVHATAGVVRLLSPDGNTLEIISSSGLSADLQEEAESISELGCEVNDIATLGDTTHASDISACNFRPGCRHSNCLFLSLIAVPLLLSSAESRLGVLTVFFDMQESAARIHTRSIEAFAQMMSSAIEHTRLNRELRRNERLVARQVIANDIHDSIAQSLIFSRTRVSLLREAILGNDTEMSIKFARDLDDALEGTQKSVRKFITDFRSEMNAGGLLAAFNDITSQFMAQNDIILEYHNRLVDLELPLEYEIQTYHVVREALTNISRHSGATHARLFVDKNFGYYVFTVEDNGRGAGTFSPVEGHYGVMIMRERAQRIGGTLKVESASGLGTQVQLYFPEPSSDWRASNE